MIETVINHSDIWQKERGLRTFSRARFCMQFTRRAGVYLLCIYHTFQIALDRLFPNARLSRSRNFISHIPLFTTKKKNRKQLDNQILDKTVRYSTLGSVNIVLCPLQLLYEFDMSVLWKAKLSITPIC